MLYINDDNEYDSNNEHDEFLELNPEIKSEIEYDRKICIIDFYKDKLYYEPDFTGIRNIFLFSSPFIHNRNYAYSM